MEIDVQATLDKVKALSDKYWRERFIDMDKRRQEKVDDVIEGFSYLFTLVQEEVLDNLSKYFTKYADSDGKIDKYKLSLNLTPSERSKAISDVDDILNKISDSNIPIDKDVTARINKLNNNKRFSRANLIELYNQLEVEYLFGTIENLYFRHNHELIEDFYYGTIYEIFFAAGYGTKPETLDESVITQRLSETWRPTEEDFTDLLWRYKRTMFFDVNKIITQGEDFVLGYELVTENMNKLMKNNLNNINAQLRTDSTYFSTRGQEEAFEYLGIEEAVFTAVLDERTTEMCRTADGMILGVDEIRPWINAPPLHYNCRSTMIPIVLKLDYLTGDIYAMEDMSMDTWYDRYL